MINMPYLLVTFKTNNNKPKLKKKILIELGKRDAHPHKVQPILSLVVAAATAAPGHKV